MDQHIVAILDCICTGILLAMFYVLFRQYRIDILRASLGHVRNRLFEAAEQGIIAFNTPAYQMTRTTLDGLIDIAPRVSLANLLFFTLTRRFWVPDDYADDYLRARARALRELSPEAREFIDRTMNDAHGRILAHLLFTSIFTVALAFLVKILIQYQTKLGAVRKWFGKLENRTKNLDKQAYEVAVCADPAPYVRIQIMALTRSIEMRATQR